PRPTASPASRPASCSRRGDRGGRMRYGSASMPLPSFESLDVDNRRVLLRVDFNVPLRGRGDAREVVDDTRIRASLPTIEALLARDARLIICSHLGRPKGKFDPEQSLGPVAARLSELLDRPVRLPDEVVGDGVT